jgi:hypothetical protein
MKYLFALIIVLFVGFGSTSCKKEPVCGTAYGIDCDSLLNAQDSIRLANGQR